MRGKIEEHNLLIKFLICESGKRDCRLEAVVYKVLTLSFRWDEQSKGVSDYPAYIYI